MTGYPGVEKGKIVLPQVDLIYFHALPSANQMLSTTAITDIGCLIRPSLFCETPTDRSNE